MTLRFTACEAAELEARAEAEGVSLSKLLRGLTLRANVLSQETRAVLAELGRLREALVRTMEVGIGPEAVAQIVSEVEAIDERILVVRAVTGSGVGNVVD